MRRLITLLSATMLALAITAGPVAAATTTSDATAWFGGESVGGGPYTQSSSCRASFTFTNPPLTSHRWRCALEFDISGIPNGATITAATLSLRAPTVDFACAAADIDCSVDLSGYAGNGTGEVDDLAAGSLLFTMPEVGANFAYSHHDVTAFVTGLYASAADWAGFRLSNDELGNQIYDSPEGEFPPLLTIEYTVPAPPPAATSLPNAAMPESGPMSDIAGLGFGLLLIGSLAALAVTSVRTRTS